jgi:cell division protein FtsW (lipid II flippase)
MIAGFIMFVVAQIPPQRLMAFAVPLYTVGVALLVAVALFGLTKKGARRWLNVGIVIQPSEIMKIAMPLMLAWWFQKREGQLRPLDFLVAGLLLMVPVGLIMRQPDLGTSILVLSAGMAVIFFAGLSWWLIVPPIILGVIGVGLVVLTATAITAVRRSTWSANDLPMPTVPPPDDLVRTQPPTGTVEWLNRYDMRLISGPIPSRWDGGAASPDPALASLSRLWVRDEPARTLDFPALAAMADVFFPRIWLRRAVPVPVGTVSLTVYFHATAPQLLETATGYLLGQARGQAFCNGYFDQAGQLWNAAGHLLATTHQLVYYKE